MILRYLYMWDLSLQLGPYKLGVVEELRVVKELGMMEELGVVEELGVMEELGMIEEFGMMEELRVVNELGADDVGKEGASLIGSITSGFKGWIPVALKD